MARDTGERIIQFIDAFSLHHGYPPSFDEMVKGVPLSSTSQVTYWLMRLRDRGLIEYEDGKARTVRVIG